MAPWLDGCFDQAGDLGAAVAAGVLEVVQHYAAIVFTTTGVAKALGDPAAVDVAL